jgi:hypothetical protein
MMRRVTPTEIRLLSQLHTFLDEGELVNGATTRSDFYTHNWRLARAESFDPLKS